MSAREVVALAPGHAQVYRALFERAFPDNPEWSGCFCLYYHCEEEPWSSEPATAARHCEARLRQIAAGTARGWLAFEDDRAVGWLNAGPRDGFGHLRGCPAADDADALVMCFVVPPEERGRGIASALLDGAVAGLLAAGARVVEAFPSARAAEAFSPAAAYKGTPSMYESRGFALLERDGRLVARLEAPSG